MTFESEGHRLVYEKKMRAKAKAVAQAASAAKVEAVAKQQVAPVAETSAHIGAEKSDEPAAKRQRSTAACITLMDSSDDESVDGLMNG